MEFIYSSSNDKEFLDDIEDKGLNRLQLLASTLGNISHWQSWRRKANNQSTLVQTYVTS
jgi:hypothetical protein